MSIRTGRVGCLFPAAGAAAVSPGVNYNDVVLGRVRAFGSEHLVLGELAAGQLLAVVVVDDELCPEEHPRDDEHHSQDDQNPYDRQVSGPIKPSTESPCAACHILVAASVTGP